MLQKIPAQAALQSTIVAQQQLQRRNAAVAAGRQALWLTRLQRALHTPHRSIARHTHLNRASASTSKHLYLLILSMIFLICCRVEVISSEFDGKRLVARHQMMYKLLDDEIKAGVHALSMDTKTPQEAGL